MDISSTRLTALLREAMIVAAAPSSKVDPVKTELIKVLVQPPAPSGAPLQPALTQALQALLPAAAANAQQTGSAEVMRAYLALAEPDSAAPDDAVPKRTAAPANDDTQRGLPVPQARVDDGAAAKPAGLPWLAFLVPEVSPQRRASAATEAAKRGQATSRSNESQPENWHRMRVGLMSLAAGFLAVAIIGLVLLVLR